MEKEIKILEGLKNLASRYLNTLKPLNDQNEMYIAQIKLTNYDELGCVLNNMLKLCIIAIDHNANIINKNKNSAIDVSLILEVLLQLFPVDEFELLTEINQKLIVDTKTSL